MCNDREYAELAWANRQLRSTGRGKHLVQFSYYHVDLIAALPDVAKCLQITSQRFGERQPNFNVVKLTRSRLSFLLYQPFSEPFPALLTSLACDIARGTSRFTDYTRRRSPPILHRKELLLPADHLLVPGAAKLTERLESLGAFKDATRIGTRDGWLARLGSLGLTIRDGELVTDA